MATRWPTDILQIGDPPRGTWGRIYGVSIDQTLIDGLGDDELLSTRSGRAVTASADIRGGTADVGETLTAPDGQVWIITAVAPSDFRWGGGITLTIQQAVVVE